MIGFKQGVRAFPEASQAANLKSEPSHHNLSAGDRQKVLSEGENVGDFLNSVADPNFAAKKPREVGKNQLGKDDFMKLMLAQLQNQDPTNTMKSHDMAAQMAQFTSLEQLTNISRGVEKLGSGNNSTGNYEALNFIGKVASGDSSKVSRTSAEDKHDLHFDLKADAMNIKITLKDALGDVVRELEVKDLKKGKNIVKWNGLTNDGFKARPGEYQFDIEAKSLGGNKIHAETKFHGAISGVQFTAAGPILMVGDQTVRLSDVKKLIDPSLTEDQKLKNKKALDLSQSGKINENKNQEDKDLASAPVQHDKGNIGKLAMNRQLMQQVEKERK